MEEPSPIGLDALFGGRARTRILGYLAGASCPLTGYAVAKELGLGVSKVYPELRRLAAARVITGRLSMSGRRLYSLDDADLRRFLVRRVRVLRAQDWFAPEQVAARRRAAEIVKKLPPLPAGSPAPAVRRAPP